MKLSCLLLGHGKRYKIKIQKPDGKIYEVITCHRCWREKEKEVK